MNYTSASLGLLPVPRRGEDGRLCMGSATPSRKNNPAKNANQIKQVKPFQLCLQVKGIIMTPDAESRDSLEVTRPIPSLTAPVTNIIGIWNVRTTWETEMTSKIATRIK